MSTNIANHKPASITALCKEIAILKEEVQGQQSSGASKKKIKKMNKTKNKNKVRKTQHGKRSFTKSSLVKSKSVPNSHSPTGDVEGGTSSPRSEQLYRQSDDGKSIINVNIFRNELIKIRQVSSFGLPYGEQMEEVKAIDKLKKKLSKYKAKNAMCDRVLINGEKYSVVANGYILSPLIYYKNAGDTITWNGQLYEVTNSGYYTSQHGSRVNDRVNCHYFTSLGFCEKGSNCPYVHNKKKIRICPYYLNGYCADSNCLLSHTPNCHNTPLCYFNLENRCTKSQCRYSHLVPEHYGDKKYEISICRPFSVGHWCPRGRNCPFLHVWNCPDYEEELACPRGDYCSLNHLFTLSMQDGITTKPNKYIREQTLVEGDEEESVLPTPKIRISSYTVDPSVLLATDTRGNYQHYIDQIPHNDRDIEPAPSTQFLIEISSDEEHFFESDDEETKVKKEKDYDGNFVEFF
ncbi:Zinc finger C-x8-C-x5-C-x3-H type (and similar) family protein [Candida parapsilosis]|uniref:C3H1-type domain-containing protein n=2 Tax=Candida parapsilosis TaxID=5480 RepID=G8BC05_CANPC|nr:uncharacterized protein CPAR2_802200 [Candida parapsilosis]KAF6051569.1 Zinc finger C-x8-C-x5-C-x3-H type (and similar) family protein [Candida parapsilosis]KAF6052934.1 Zinc finger C-x8-C-x5-C-x3-H type (and similar) family protein [Candida parapsilosis]KAF6053371.1 Zinc finger C-x8-C-x5-C-x3-H type (and similar) family protein [Candida parapsilosis]KAF6064712.1 Zinc finger C-x8-C-x5-C-x3-H type (and similar) family protein [Candida parapsilosis]CAD1810587.1 unnamed protein product [Candid